MLHGVCDHHLIPLGPLGLRLVDKKKENDVSVDLSFTVLSCFTCLVFGSFHGVHTIWQKVTFAQVCCEPGQKLHKAALNFFFFLHGFISLLDFGFN